MTEQTPIVIVGTGLSGYSLVREFRKLDKETPVIMVTADDGVSYSKPMLSTGFTKDKDADGLAQANPEAMADSWGWTFVPGPRLRALIPMPMSSNWATSAYVMPSWFWPGAPTSSA